MLVNNNLETNGGKAMIEDFVFQNTTKVYFGREQMQHLGEEVSQYGRKVLMVYGGGSIKRNGLYDRIMREMEKSGVSVLELAGVEPNPRHTTVNRGAKLCREENVDVILAVGGGSTIDCSKGISGLSMAEVRMIWELVENGTPCKMESRSLWSLPWPRQDRKWIPAL